MKTKLILGIAVAVTLGAGTVWIFAKPTPPPAPAPLAPSATPPPQDLTPSLPPAVTQTIYDLSLSPASIIANRPTLITITANVGPDSTLLRDSITLLRYDSTRTLISTHGRLYDDGTHGDKVAGDSSFMTQITITDQTPRTTLFRVSAAYRGSLRRVMSDVAPFHTFPSGLSSKETLIFIADALDRGDTATAMTRIWPSVKNRQWISEMSLSDKQGFASSLRSTSLVSDDGAVAIYTVADAAELMLTRSPSGDWLLMNW